MGEETADILNQEQLFPCIKWLDEQFQIQEDFIGLYPMVETNNNAIVQAIKVSSIFIQ